MKHFSGCDISVGRPIEGVVSAKEEVEVLRAVGSIVNVRPTVKTMVRHLSCTVRGLGGVVTVPTVYVREVHTRNHFAGVVPLDKIRCAR